MSKHNLVSMQVPFSVMAAASFEGMRGLKSDSVQGFWVRAFNWLIAVQKRRAESALKRYYDEF